MKHQDWAERRASDFNNIDPDTDIAILPTAAIEQHGPHLPVGTDTMIMQGMLDRFRVACPESLQAWILPIQSVGKSNEHLWAAGTLTYSANTALSAWTDIGLSVARAGFKKIVIVNSHGGNLDLISILSRELRVQAGMLAVKCQWNNFGHPEGLYTDKERRFGIHGGDIETSLMLHLYPDCVDMQQAIDFTSSAQTDAVSPIGPISRGWIATDLNPAGTVGNAAIATAEKGRQTLEYQVAGFIDLLQDVQSMPVPVAKVDLT